MGKEYDNYLVKHINNVKTAFMWLGDHGLIDDLVDYSNIAVHDQSKYSAEEYVAYDMYFYGEKTSEVKEVFDVAWLHHIHNNPHHWQHWILMEDDPENGKSYKCLMMPYKYVVEMICDWWSFSFSKGDLSEILSWYEDHKKTIKLHPETRQLVETILKRIHDEITYENHFIEPLTKKEDRWI